MKRRSLSRILIVEDEPLIALGIQELLIASGFEVAGVAGKLARALELVELRACDAAIVDANLAGVSAGPVGAALTALALPYIVLSGYSASQHAGAFPGAEVFLQKPCAPDRLIEAVSKIVRFD